MNITKRSLVVALAFGLLISPLGTIVAQAQTGNSNGAPGNARTQEFRIERKDIIRKEVKNATSSVRVDSKAVKTQTRVKSDVPKIKRVEAFRDNQAKMKLTVDARKKEINLRIKAQLATSSATSTKKLDNAAKNRVRAHIENIYKRLSQHIERIAEIDGKVAARINLISDSGIEMADVETQYEKAKASLEKAKADVTATKALATDKTATTTPSVSKVALRTLVKTAEDSIKAAIREYKATIELMKKYVKANINSSEQGALRSMKNGSTSVETSGTTTASTTVTQ